MQCLIRTWTRMRAQVSFYYRSRFHPIIYLGSSCYTTMSYILHTAARVRCRVAGDSHELVYTADLPRQISSRSDCGLAMDHCEGTSADAYWPLRVLSFARMPRLERCRQQKLLQRLLCLFILPFLSFGLRYSPRQLTAATSCNKAATEDGLSHLFHSIG